MSTNQKLLIALTLISVVVIIFDYCYRTAFKQEEENCYSFSEGERKALRRMNNLFQDVPIYNGHEWKTLSVDELMDVCITAIELQCKMQQSIKGYSRTQLVFEMADRCSNLSVWMQNNAKRPFYAESDMTYLIEKPREVARQLLDSVG